MIASIDVDAQKSFTELCPLELPIRGALEIVDGLNFNASLADCRIGTKDAHPLNPVWLASSPKQNGSKMPTDEEGCYYYQDAREYWVAHCVVGTRGFELLDGLPKPEDYDFFVWKGMERDLHPYGACYHDFNESVSTGLIEFLRCKNIDTIIIGGLALDFCVRQTILQLKRAGFSRVFDWRIILNLSATRSLSQNIFDLSNNLQKQYGILIARNNQELKDLTDY